jgi:beta-N-acetylhexosaminidase
VRRGRAAAVLVAALLAGCAGGTSTTGREDTPAARTAAAAPHGPTSAQLAGGHVVFPFAGTTPPRALLARLRRGEAAGVILLGRNIGSPARLRALTRRLRAAVPRGGPPPLIMVDQEGGSVKRLPGAPTRSAPEMAATGDPAVARAEGRATARTLRRAGVNVDLAPVVDVARPGGALAGEGRGFGPTAASAARFGSAFAAGLRAGGVAATAKHFPGFGAAAGNTDFGTESIGLSAQTLRTVDRPPFAAAVGAGAQLVMLASAVYPAFSTAPAVLSRRVVERELRAGLGFSGVTVSDDLEAPAFSGRGGAPGAAVAAARAGVDLLLFARTYTGAARATRALAAAIRARRVDRSRLEAGLQRVDALRRSLR